MCKFVSGAKDDSECRKYPVDPSNKKNNVCVINSAGGCEEKIKCLRVKGINGDTCPEYPAKDSRKVCIKNEEYVQELLDPVKPHDPVIGGDLDYDLEENKDKPPQDQNQNQDDENDENEEEETNTICKEEFLCSQANEGKSDEECMSYILSDDTKFICRKKTEGLGCEEVPYCDTVTGEELTDSECNKYPVSKDNSLTHICIKDPNNNKCMEKYLCELVPKTLTEIICSDYPVKIGKEDTHYCSENVLRIQLGILHA